MSLNNQLVAMSEKQPWKFFALQGLSFQFLGLNFQFLEGNFKMSEPCEHAFLEGKKAEKTSPRKSPSRTLKEVRQQ
jgi:hypothetical protein